MKRVIAMSDAATERTAAEDPALGQSEKEFAIRVNKAEQVAVVHSEIGSITRHLLTRSDFEKRNVREVDGEVVAVTGELPMGTVKVQQNARKFSGFSHIVAEHTGGDGQ